jgi:hypothetical protein
LATVPLDAPAPRTGPYDELAGRRYLGASGRREIKTRLRQARTAVLREWIVAITPLAALLLGLIGLVIGLFALWPSR